jgi:hypothetical protein
MVAPSPPPAPGPRLGRGPPRGAVLLGLGAARLTPHNGRAASGPEAMRAGGRRRTSRRVRGCRTWPAPGRRDPRVSVGDYPSVPPLSSTGRRRRRRRLQAIGWSHYLDDDGDASVPASGEVVRPHYFAPDGWRRPGKTAVRTAVSPRLLIRMRSQVQVQPGPPPNPAGQSVAVLGPAALVSLLVHIWSTSRATRHRQPPHESGPDGPATPGPPPGTDAHSGPR